MKKLLALVLALTMAFALVACGNNNSGNAGNNGGTNAGDTNDGGDTGNAGGEEMRITLITMDPVIGKIQTEAWEPYREQEIGGEEFIDRSADALKEYMLRDTKLNTLRMYCDLAHIEVPEDDAGLREQAMDLSLRVIVPAFMTQELQAAFYTGLLLYIPFLLIDIVVSSTLMSMGMIMLPPAMISTPFKLLLFVSINGWDLLFSSLVQGVN